MPASKKRTAPAAKVDPTSDEILLVYVGDGAILSDTPARDLSHADVARLAYRRAAAETLAEGERPDPLKPGAKAIAAVTEDLLASGHFTAAARPVAAAQKEAAAEQPAPEPTTEPAPDQPADEQPEG